MRTLGSSLPPSALTGTDALKRGLDTCGSESPVYFSSLTSAPRTLQFGHMSVTVERNTVQEIKGDTVAPGLEGLLSLRPDDFVFYVGGYPSNFTVSLAPPLGSPVCLELVGESPSSCSLSVHWSL